MLIEVGGVIRVCAADPAGLIHLEVLHLLPAAVSDFSWKIDIPGLEHIVADQTVEGAFTNHKCVFVVCTDMVEGLSL